MFKDCIRLIKITKTEKERSFSAAKANVEGVYASIQQDLPHYIIQSRIKDYSNDNANIKLAFF